jgi:hypothetical protein
METAKILKVVCTLALIFFLSPLLHGWAIGLAIILYLLLEENHLFAFTAISAATWFVLKSLGLLYTVGVDGLLIIGLWWFFTKRKTVN